MSTSEEETLLTNLPESEVEHEAFAELYAKRWSIETKYGELKRKLETENFSGRLDEDEGPHRTGAVQHHRVHSVRLVNRTKIILALDEAKGRATEKQEALARRLGVSRQGNSI